MIESVSFSVIYTLDCVPSHCTLDSVDSLYPQLALCTLSPVVSVLTVSLYSRAVLSIMYTRTALSTLYSQPLVTVLSVPRQCDTVVVTQVQHSGTVKVGHRRSGTRCTDRQ